MIADADLEGYAKLDLTNTFTEFQKLYADLPIVSFADTEAEFTVMAEFGESGTGLPLFRLLGAHLEFEGQHALFTGTAIVEIGIDGLPTGRHIITFASAGTFGGNMNATTVIADSLNIASVFSREGVTTLPLLTNDPVVAEGTESSVVNYAATRGWVNSKFYQDVPLSAADDPDAEFTVLGSFGDGTGDGTPMIVMVAARVNFGEGAEIRVEGLGCAEFDAAGVATGRYTFFGQSTGNLGSQGQFAAYILPDLKISSIFGGSPTPLPVLTSDPTPNEFDPSLDFYAATQGWVKARLAEIPSAPSFDELNVADYGAVLDGVTDDWASINDALSDAAATGRDVYIPEGTTLVKRTIVVPGGVRLRGAGMDRTTITRPLSVGTEIVGHVGVGEVTVNVVDASMFTVGDPIHLWDVVHYEGDDTRRYVTEINGNTITFDLPTLLDYDESDGGRVSTSFALICSETNSEHGAISDMTVDQNMSDFDPKGTFNGGDIQVEFTIATIHLEQARFWKVERVRFIRAFGDAFSDQGRADLTGSNHNELAWCEFISPFRHAIHLGTTNDGSRVHHNVVRGVDKGYGFFFCATVTNCVVDSNFFLDSTAGLAGIDQRDAFNIVSSNTFWNVPQALLVAGVSEDPTLPFGLVVDGNVFYTDQDAPLLGVSILLNLPNVVFSNNRLHNQFLRVADTSEKCVVTGNIFGGDTDYDKLPPGGGSDWRMWVEADDVVISDNIFENYISGAVQVMGANRMIAKGNRMINGLLGNWGWTFSLEDSVDCVIDGGAHQFFDSFNDPDGKAVRLIFNGLGFNGQADPATSGPWSGVAALGSDNGQHNGTMVRWLNDNSQTVISLFIAGVGWITLGLS